MQIRKHTGFTLVEIAVSIAILGVALTALIGLHSSYLGTFVNERNLTRAALFAKQIMTTIEIDENPPETGSKEGNLYDLIKEQEIEDREYLKELREEIEGWTYTKEVSSIDVPPVEDAMRRIDLSIRWGERVGQEFTLVYFVRNEQ